MTSFFYMVIKLECASGRKPRWIHPNPTLCSVCGLNWSCVANLLFYFLFIMDFKYLSCLSLQMPFLFFIPPKKEKDGLITAWWFWSPFGNVVQ